MPRIRFYRNLSLMALAVLSGAGAACIAYRQPELPHLIWGWLLAMHCTLALLPMPKPRPKRTPKPLAQTGNARILPFSARDTRE